MTKSELLIGACFGLAVAAVVAGIFAISFLLV